jgi:hypothetical protein
LAKNSFTLAAVSAFENARTTWPWMLSNRISMVPFSWLYESAYLSVEEAQQLREVMSEIETYGSQPQITPMLVIENTKPGRTGRVLRLAYEKALDAGMDAEHIHPAAFEKLIIRPVR